MLDPMILLVLRADFLSFARKFFPILYPTMIFKDNWHIAAMAEALRQMREGTTPNLLVTMPPRCLKSYIMSVAWPAFLLGQDPWTRIVVISYGDTLTEQLSNDTRRLMETPEYRALFPGTVLTKSTSRDLQTTEGGRRFGTTIGGALTGMGGQWFVIDDPLNASNAYSELARKQVIDFFNHTLTSRPDDPSTARFIIIMQRLHEDDLAGHVLRQAGWTHLKLQARATEALTINVGGGRVHQVEPGDLLHPERLDEAILERYAAQMGSSAFEAQYQQNPLPADGNQIKRDWLRFYSSAPPRETGITVQSWDTATKTAVENDYSVCTTWLLKDGTSYLLDVWRGKVGFPALREQVITLHNRYSPSHVLIEDANSGSSLIQDLLVTSPFNVVPWRPPLAKAARVDVVSGALEAGRIQFPKEAPWLAQFLGELLAFPGGRHDDQVDSLTQYAIWAGERSRSSFFEADFGFNVPVTMEGIASHLANIRGVWR